MIRISPYLVADLLKLLSENSIPNFIKMSIQNCINQLISVCDQHGLALLSRTLPVSMQEIFKTQLDTYNKFYKFIKENHHAYCCVQKATLLLNRFGVRYLIDSHIFN